MKLLADTHLLLWLANDSPKLTLHAKTLLLDPANDIFFSSATIWETAIKFALGRDANFTLPPQVFRTAMLRTGFIEILVNSDHAVAISALPSTHGDPFDRLLVAQALVEHLLFITADKVLSSYPNTLRV